MSPSGAYSGGLFDPGGPRKFMEAIAGIPPELEKIVDAFSAIDAKSTAALTNIQQRLAGINTLTGQIGSVGSSVGGSQGGSRWGSAPPSPASTGGIQGNTMGVGGRGNAPGPFVSQTPGTPNGGQQQVQGGGGGWQRAGMAASVALPAFAGAAQRFTQANMSDTMSENLNANMMARAMPGGWTLANQNRFSSIPRGSLAQSGADYATAQATAQMGLGAIPSPVFSKIAGLSPTGKANSALVNNAQNAFQWLAPGASRTQVTQSLTGLYSPQAYQAGLMNGILNKDKGQYTSPDQIFDSIVSKAFTGGYAALAKLTPDQILQAFAPGSAIYVTAQLMFQGDETLFQAFYTYATTKIANQLSSNPATRSANPMTAAGAKQSGLKTTMQQTGLAATSAKNAAISETTAGQAQATETFNNATKTFSNAVDSFLKGTGLGSPIGKGLAGLGSLGGPLGGGIGMLTSILGLGGGGGGGGGLGGMLGMAGGALGITKLMGMLGGAGGAAGAAGGAAGAAEAAGATAAGGAAAGGAAAAAGTLGIGAAGAAAAFGLTKFTSMEANKANSMLGGGTLGAAAKFAINAGGAVSNPLGAAAGINNTIKSGRSFINHLFGGGGGGGSTPTQATNTSASVGAGATGVSDMVKALYNAGFRGSALQSMVAYGISESGGNSNVLNNNPATGDYSVGWFQINYFGNLMASRTARYGDPNSLRSDPQKQANAAWDLSAHGTNFGPWSGDIANGHYANNLPAAQAAVKAAGYARGSYNIATTQLALLHAGERVIPASENYSNTGRYSRGGAGEKHLHIHLDSVTLTGGATKQDAKQIVSLVSAEAQRQEILERIGNS